MSTELQNLYQEMILDHNRSPRNFGKLPSFTHKAEGYNPLCGDRLTLYLKLEGDRIGQIKFEGSGCAISKASASLMTGEIQGKGRAELEPLVERFHKMVTGKGNADEMGKLAVFSGVSEFPARVKCATLAWHTLKAALEGKGETISTEDEDHGAAGSGAPPAESGGLREKIVAMLETCYDPEIPVNIHELGLIYEINIRPPGDVDIMMTLTSPACPVAGSLPPEVEGKIKRVPGVTACKVNVVWEPSWTPEKMSEAARLQLGIG